MKDEFGTIKCGFLGRHLLRPQLNWKQFSIQELRVASLHITIVTLHELAHAAHWHLFGHGHENLYFGNEIVPAVGLAYEKYAFDGLLRRYKSEYLLLSNPPAKEPYTAYKSGEMVIRGGVKLEPQTRWLLPLGEHGAMGEFYSGFLAS